MSDGHTRPAPNCPPVPLTNRPIADALATTNEHLTHIVACLSAISCSLERLLNSLEPHPCLVDWETRERLGHTFAVIGQLRKR